MNEIKESLARSYGNEARHPWRPFFWEPVSGTGERLMVGIVYRFNNEWGSRRIIRDEILEAMYGSASQGAITLIESSLKMALEAVRTTNEIETLAFPLLCLLPGDYRETGATSVADLLRTAALLYSSLANIDALDEQDEAEAPSATERNRTFASQIKDIVLRGNPSLAKYFGAKLQTVAGGKPIRFGFGSPSAIMHFSVIPAVNVNQSFLNAHGRLFELQLAGRLAGIQTALIAAAPRPDDPTVGTKQRTAVNDTCASLQKEASLSGIEFFTVHSTEHAAERVIALSSGAH